MRSTYRGWSQVNREGSAAGQKAAPAQVAPKIGPERLDADARRITERVRESLPDAHPVQDPQHRRVPVAPDQEVERVVRSAVSDPRLRPRELHPVPQQIHVGVLHQPL